MSAKKRSTRPPDRDSGKGRPEENRKTNAEMTPIEKVKFNLLW